MRIETLERELENCAHTLIDVKTIMKCMDETKKGLEPRVQMLEQRIYHFNIEIQKEKSYQEKRQNE